MELGIYQAFLIMSSKLSPTPHQLRNTMSAYDCFIHLCIHIFKSAKVLIKAWCNLKTHQAKKCCCLKRSDSTNTWPPEFLQTVPSDGMLHGKQNKQ